MIGVFPKPYPDETMYSIYARYKHMMGYARDRDALRDLFDCDKIENIKGPLQNCDALFQRVPQGWLGSAEDFLLNHTGWPFNKVGGYEPSARFYGKPNIPPKCDLTPSGHYIDIGFRIWLAYCSECLISDRERYGESYWHRTHQAVGVFVCPTHKLFLEFLGPLTMCRDKLLRIPPNPGGRKKQISERLNTRTPEHKLLLQIAVDTNKIFSRKLQYDLDKRFRDFYAVAPEHRTPVFLFHGHPLSYSYLIISTYSVRLLRLLNVNTSVFRSRSIEIAPIEPPQDRHPLTLLLYLYATGRDSRFLIRGVSTKEPYLPHKDEKQQMRRFDRIKLPISHVLKLEIDEPIDLPNSIFRRLYPATNYGPGSRAHRLHQNIYYLDPYF